MIKHVWLAMRGRKMNFKDAIRICVCMCIYLYMCVVVMRPMLLTFNVVHSRYWCPLCDVITLDHHCVCRTVSICIQCRVVENICCEVAV
jgi:hypothetical protein